MGQTQPAILGPKDRYPLPSSLLPHSVHTTHHPQVPNAAAAAAATTPSISVASSSAHFTPSQRPSPVRGGPISNDTPAALPSPALEEGRGEEGREQVQCKKASNGVGRRSVLEPGPPDKGAAEGVPGRGRRLQLRRGSPRRDTNDGNKRRRRRGGGGGPRGARLLGEPVACPDRVGRGHLPAGQIRAPLLEAPGAGVGGRGGGHSRGGGHQVLHLLQGGGDPIPPGVGDAAAAGRLRRVREPRRVRVRERHPARPPAGRGGAVLGGGGRRGPGVVRGGVLLQACARPRRALPALRAAQAEALRAPLGAGAHRPRLAAQGGGRVALRGCYW